MISSDHLERVATWQSQRLQDQPGGVAALSGGAVNDLGGLEAATWTDRELVSGNAAFGS